MPLFVTQGGKAARRPGSTPPRLLSLFGKHPFPVRWGRCPDAPRRNTQFRLCGAQCALTDAGFLGFVVDRDRHHRPVTQKPAQQEPRVGPDVALPRVSEISGFLVVVAWYLSYARHR